jgi:hypothetical protein
MIRFLLCAALGTSTLCAGDFSSYRGLEFGMSLSTAANRVGTRPAEVTIVHQRPALIQEMDWRPQPIVPADPADVDPAKDGLLYFINGELFRIVVTYDRYRVEGMTAEDMIQGISAACGMATRPAGQIAYQSNYGKVAPIVARLEDSEHSYNLVRTGDQTSFALILYSKHLDALAQAAIVEAARLDAQDAPRREIEKQKMREEEDRIVLEKARSLNKPNFRP